MLLLKPDGSGQAVLLGQDITAGMRLQHTVAGGDLARLATGSWRQFRAPGNHHGAGIRSRRLRCRQSSGTVGRLSAIRSADRVPHAVMRQYGAEILNGSASRKDKAMLHSRRRFLAGVAAAIGTTPLAGPVPAAAQKRPVFGSDFVSLKSLPGDVGLKIHAPAANGRPEFPVESDSSKQLFVGSAFKTFVLCEALRQPTHPKWFKLEGEPTGLDACVWSLDSATLIHRT